MAKPEWGVKRTCPTTGQRFYDLNKDPIISPYTGEIVELASAIAAKGKVSAATAKKPTADDDEELDDDDDMDDDLEALLADL